MQRRQFNHVLTQTVLVTPLWLAAKPAQALTQAQAAQALKDSLQAGAQFAVKQLGTTDGFWAAEKVRIPLPPFLAQAQPLLKTFGQGQRLNALHLAINRAAESAVASALPLLQGAVSRLSVNDAVSILKGGDTAVTDYFAAATRAPLQAQFLPVVRRTTDQYNASAQYTKLLAKAKRFGVGKDQPDTVADHVTATALDSLYATLSEAEQRLRANPRQAATQLLRQVFGSL